MFKISIILTIVIDPLSFLHKHPLPYLSTLTPNTIMFWQTVLIGFLAFFRFSYWLGLSSPNCWVKIGMLAYVPFAVLYCVAMWLFRRSIRRAPDDNFVRLAQKVGLFGFIAFNVFLYFLGPSNMDLVLTGYGAYASFIFLLMALAMMF